MTRVPGEVELYTRVDRDRGVVVIESHYPAGVAFPSFAPLSAIQSANLRRQLERDELELETGIGSPT